MRTLPLDVGPDAVTRELRNPLPRVPRAWRTDLLDFGMDSNFHEMGEGS